MHAAELETLLDWFQRQPAERQNGNAVENEALDAAVRGHLREAVSAATRGRGWSPSRNGAIRERVVGHLDAAETDVLRRAPLDYLRGQLSHVLAHVQLHLPGNDPRRQQVEELVRRDDPRHIDASAREAIVHAVSVASEESRREFARVRNFCQALYSAAIILTVTAVAVAAWGFRFPEHLSMCFSPGVDLVCPTGSAQSPYDVALVMVAGLLAAAVSGSVSLRHITGTSTGIMLPIALAILKLPTGP